MNGGPTETRTRTPQGLTILSRVRLPIPPWGHSETYL